MMMLGIGSRVGVRLAVVGYRENRKPITEHRITQTAFTLIEVLIAITILAGGMLGVIRAYSSSISALEIGQYTIDTVCLLKNSMAKIEKAVIEEGTVLPGYDRGSFEGRDKGFEWELEVKVMRFNVPIEEGKKEGDEEQEQTRSKDSFLNKVKLTVFNETVKPVRRISIVTYMDYVEMGKDE